MSKLFFPKDLKLKKYFWYFCEKEKVLEKFQHAENEFENFKYAVEKQQMRCKENLKSGKSKYETNSNLPLARARRLKSDVHDFSPPYLPFVGSSWRTGRGRTLDLSPHLLFLLLSFRCGVLLDHEVLLFPLLKPEKYVLPSDTEIDFSLSDIDPCLGKP